MTPPTGLQVSAPFIACCIQHFIISATAIDPLGFGGVMTPPYNDFI